MYTRIALLDIHVVMNKKLLSYTQMTCLIFLPLPTTKQPLHTTHHIDTLATVHFRCCITTHARRVHLIQPLLPATLPALPVIPHGLVSKLVKSARTACCFVALVEGDDGAVLPSLDFCMAAGPKGLAGLYAYCTVCGGLN